MKEITTPYSDLEGVRILEIRGWKGLYRRFPTKRSTQIVVIAQQRYTDESWVFERHGELLVCRSTLLEKTPALLISEDPDTGGKLRMGIMIPAARSNVKLEVFAQ